MITNIDALYEFTLQQMAAESYLEGETSTQGVTDRLILGTNRVGYKGNPPDLNEGYRGYTRMTSSQADEFLSKYSIVHQWSDNPNGVRPTTEGNPAFDQLNDEILANTGLSATLIKNKSTGQYTLAIRSTEFRPWSEGGDDCLDGGDGIDRLEGGGGDDLLFGGAGNDSSLREFSVVSGAANEQSFRSVA